MFAPKKYIIQIFVSLCLISLVAACSEQKVPLEKNLAETPKIESTEPTASKVDMTKCICVQLWMPVCGENEKTYSNSCFAKCAGVKFKQGSCTKLQKD